jgi:hypothetical protein
MPVVTLFPIIADRFVAPRLQSSPIYSSEILVLRCPDVDAREGDARVSKAQSKDRLNDRTKNATAGISD